MGLRGRRRRHRPEGRVGCACVYACRGFWRAGKTGLEHFSTRGEDFIDFAYIRCVSVLQHGVQVFIDFAYIRCVGYILVVMALRHRVGLASTVDTWFWTSGLAERDIQHLRRQQGGTGIDASAMAEMHGADRTLYHVW